MVMDDIDRQLLDLLCTKIGIVMEDHSALALTAVSQSEGGKVAIEVDPNDAGPKELFAATAIQATRVSADDGESGVA